MGSRALFRYSVKRWALIPARTAAAVHTLFGPIGVIIPVAAR